ncbi:MAG: tRNA (N(6)-L-threonylcarbamoyladenosine(37)-C(2))-methylthiotransferase MtaB [Lachnospiraceae bacterium]|jgi:threonylcarbamoyladenosine tRNA methylthiotransferase MtaB|nr:tRNA (N(6)-L-threonylcarbamoyladenosine(37)-C(2))-methylthiotransferase MtaB [Lachnospiraceae bacterium]
MKKVAFHNLGCKVNSYELDGISQMFQKRGYEIVEFAQKADVYIVNTCTVTNIADRKSRQMLGRAKRQNPDAVVVAAGCFVQNDPEGAASCDYIDIAVGNNHKAEIVDIVESYLALPGENRTKQVTVSDLATPCEYENISVSETSGHTRAFMKIQDGCNQFCSYCAIPLARGRARSRRIEDIEEEAVRLSQNGYKEIVITGIHLSSYGLDTYNTFADKGQTNTALLDAVETVAGKDGIERIRLGSLEPRLLTEEFVKRLSEIPKLCPHFHISLQSGCDSVLARMNRHYDTAEFAEKVDLVRRYFEHPAITTDIIVGFPGETEEEFETTRVFLKETDLYECHIFKYSRRKGTVADKMPGQLTDAVKSARSTILIRESNERKRAFEAWYDGKTVNVLTEDTEEVDGRLYTVGYTPEYVKVFMPETDSGKITEILCFEAGWGIVGEAGRRD